MITIKKITKQIQTQKSVKVIANKAAILIPIITIDEHLQLLFQVRSKKLKWQPGDICFPGGRVEFADYSPQHTAIRETYEELGIEANEITLLGQLPKFMATLGMMIYPFVAEISTLNNLHLNPDEVEEIFTVPIEWFINNPPQVANMLIGYKPANNFPFDLLPDKAKKWQKRSEHQLYFYHYNNHVIWGLTAQIIFNFIEVINKK